MGDTITVNNNDNISINSAGQLSITRNDGTIEASVGNIENTTITINEKCKYEIFTDDNETITQRQLKVFLQLFPDHDQNDISIQNIPLDTNLHVRSLTQFKDKTIPIPEGVKNNLFVFDDDETNQEYTVGTTITTDVADTKKEKVGDTNKTVYVVKQTGIWITNNKPSSYKTFGGSVGDPYIYWGNGDTLGFKLPGKPYLYRLFRNNNITINAGVSGMSRIEQQRIQDEYKKYDITNCVTDGFFFDAFYIRYNDSFVLFDRYLSLRNSNIVSMNDLDIHFDATVRSRKFPLMGHQTFTTLNIVLGGGLMTVRLYKYDSPQVINGIEVSGNDTVHSHDGLLSDGKHTYQRPSYYKIKSIKSNKPLRSSKKQSLKPYKKQIVDIYQNVIVKR
jgi:hypothetical protein